MTVKHFDVLVLGAGLSGIGAGYHLQKNCPSKTYAILEAREDLGGTWDLFRYPGIRSDSDMFTLGYSFRPWTSNKSIVDGSEILQYLRDTSREFGIDSNIRYGHRVIAAAWSSGEARWTLDIEVGEQRSPVRYSCNFFYVCSGYYSYEGGYQPDFPGLENYTGQLIHPQQWPEGLDYSGKRIVVIGSGATAVTLVPALAKKAAHVTMLQRSPSYVMSLPDDDVIAKAMRKVLPSSWVHKTVRFKNVMLSTAIYRLFRFKPEFAKRLLRKGIAAHLPQDFPIDTHFKPSYNPWDQRLCLVPNGDLFTALREQSASIVTDRISSFTPTGITLESGQSLDADIVVSATGLKLVACGGVQLTVDGAPVTIGQTYSYKGLMLSGIPNAAVCVGYTNASWTLRADLSSEFVCRLINYMSRKNYDQCRPQIDPSEMDQRPLLDMTSGYILRAVEQFPKQGKQQPWQQNQNYLQDLLSMKFTTLDDKALKFSRAHAASNSLKQSA
ncbi:flavin-containing monooxygenase [Pseudomonas marincola]|uniref:flavin-containing monooxygenase n=1 Tax=Pseudomonas marincola TaxID=437900 RepID=UPI0008E6FA05|nr:NAD(P)/FAD-dependent oxidoreductase [Pseudomonas marincola]SFU14910.1 Predicted flavoprotein CzcO associated with the cation diffusion facilitator CzcD [Pseudomonas marincola]